MCVGGRGRGRGGVWVHGYGGHVFGVLASWACRLWLGVRVKRVGSGLGVWRLGACWTGGGPCLRFACRSVLPHSCCAVRVVLRAPLNFLLNSCSRLRRGDFRCTTILFTAFSFFFSRLRRGDVRYTTILFKAFSTRPRPFPYLIGVRHPPPPPPLGKGD